VGYSRAMALDKQSPGVSEDEPERLEDEPLPEHEVMSTPRPFAHELPQPVDLPPEPPTD
jgi:hypothetical protein